jgi:hypothetical protein
MNVLATTSTLGYPGVRSPHPRYFAALSLLLLALMVFANVLISKNEVGFAVQLVAFISFTFIWLIIAGFTIRSLLFGAVALVPSVTYEGIGYLEFPGMALTPADMFMVLAIAAIAHERGFPKLSGRFSALIWIWFAVCFLSAFISADLMGRFGSLVRLLLDVLLVYFLVATKNHQYKRVVLYGMLAWPLVVFTHMGAMGQTWDFITMYQAAETSPLIGSSSYIKYFLLIVPLLLMFRVNKLFIFAVLIALMPYIILAKSRSLLLGLIFASGCFLFFSRQFKHTRNTLLKIILVATMAPILFVGVASWQGKEFSFDWSAGIQGDYLRVTKMTAAINTFLDNPVLGIGYGQAVIDAKAMGREGANLQNTSAVEFYELATSYSTSAESTPFQMIAEVGLAGTVLGLLLLLIGLKNGLSVLRDKGCPHYIKISLLCFSVIYVAEMIGGNRLQSVVFISAVPVIFHQMARKFPARKNQQ